MTGIEGCGRTNCLRETRGSKAEIYWAARELHSFEGRTASHFERQGNKCH